MSKSKVRKELLKVLGASVSKKRPAPSHGPEVEKKKRERKVRVGLRARKDEIGITFKRNF